MRGFALAALALVAGCSSQNIDAPAVAQGGEQIACALGGAADFSETCAVDRMEVSGKLMLIARHPDGAFRRFAVVTDGRGLALADGAEQAVNALQGDKLAVTVGQDRYLFPAKMKSASNNAKP